MLEFTLQNYSPHSKNAHSLFTYLRCYSFQALNLRVNTPGCKHMLRMRYHADIQYREKYFTYECIQQHITYIFHLASLNFYFR